MHEGGVTLPASLVCIGRRKNMFNKLLLSVATVCDSKQVCI